MIKAAILNKISVFIILLANSATITGCTALFHEVEIPENLKQEIKF